MTELELQAKRLELARDANTLLETYRDLRLAGEREQADALFAAITILGALSGHPLLDLFLDESLEHVAERRT